MKFNVGDKVKFLNERGGGVVSKIISASMVNVMTEDGFEIPTMTSELLKMESTGKASGMFEESFDVKLPERKERESGDDEPARDEESDRITPLGNYSFRTKNPAGVYLAWVPQDQKWLVTGKVEIYLVNHTGVDVIFALFLKDSGGSFEGMDYDAVPARSKLLLQTIDRESAGDWLEGYLQLVFFEDHPTQIWMPVSRQFKLKPSRISDERAYAESEFIEERSLLVSLAAISELETVARNEMSEKEGGAGSSARKAEVIKPANLIDSYRTGPREAVVDLHIEELLDNTKGMSGHEILEFQMRHFEKCLESAIQANYHKVTFIHGVGNGTLKNALIKRMKEYDQLENHSASLAKFGVGAIDIAIRPL